MTEFEWQKLNNNDGDLLAFKVSPFIPIEVAEQKFLFNFEVPLPQYAGLTDVGHDTGIGDTRLKLFWLIGTEQELMRAIVPSFDAVAPTGDSDTGLGGGQWILMPNVVFALQPAENLAIYPFFRYVHSDGVRPTFVPEYGLPQDIFNDVLNQENIRAFNLEVPIVFSLTESVMDWVSAKSSAASSSSSGSNTPRRTSVAKRVPGSIVSW